MTFTITPGEIDPAVKTITCDSCGDWLPSIWESVRDSWKRGHVCVYRHRFGQRSRP